MHFANFFTTLYRRVVIIQRHQPPPHKLLLTFTYIYVFLRLIVTSYSMYFDVASYFYYDVLNRLLFFESAFRKNYIVFFFSIIPIFSLRLLYLIYLCPDNLVSEHFYDLIVRNRNQAYLQFVKIKVSWLPKKLSLWTPHFKIPSSSKLLYYPFLREKVRTRCIAIYLFFEVFLAFAQLIFIFFFILTVYNLVSKTKISFNVVQVFFVGLNVLTFGVYICFLIQTFTLTMVTLDLVCYIYILEYRKLSRKLQKLNNGNSNSLRKIIKVSARYRISHSKFTTFILCYNNSTMSKIIITYLSCIMPFHAYGIVMMYFQQSDLPTFLRLNLLLTLFFFAAIFFGISITMTGVNKALVSSGPQIGAIFAKSKGFGRTIWNREALKLSSYFSLIWRCDRELGFTVGQKTTLNWKFLVDVSVCDY